MAGTAALLEASELSGERTSVRLLEGMEATWDEVTEGADGALKLERLLQLERRTARRLMQQAVGQVKRGMLRHVVLVLDLSQAMEDDDLRPNRWDCLLAAAEAFVRSFFDQNPISHMALAVMRAGRCELVADLTGNLGKLTDTLRHMAHNRPEYYPQGEVSLQNALLLSAKLLTATPSHSTREVLLVVGSLTSCDPSDVFDTIKQMAQQRIRVSVIGLAAGTKLCQTMSHDTGGTYSVVLDEAHLTELLQQHTIPPVADIKATSALVPMGFPLYKRTMVMDKQAVKQLMARKAAADGVADPPVPMTEAGVYLCPRCCAQHSDMPTECSGCGLFLVLTPHLARTFHHLFPLDEFQEEERGSDEAGACVGCTRRLQRVAYRCPRCLGLFCFECDIFIHDTLHNCPHCSQSS